MSIFNKYLIRVNYDFIYLLLFKKIYIWIFLFNIIWKF